MKAVFIRSNTPACRLIRAIDGGAWSHCAIVLPDTNDGPAMCIEAAWPGGVRIRTLAGLLADRPDHLLVGTGLPVPQAAASWLRRQVGAGYDWPALPALAIRSVFGTAPLWAQPTRWYCAELLLAACAAGGAPISGPLRRYGVAAAFDHVRQVAAIHNT